MADWRTFRIRYQDLFREMRQQCPGFGEVLHELVEAHERRRYITSGAQVREFPATQERETQTLPSPGRTIGVQTDLAPAIVVVVPPLAELPQPPGYGRGRGLRWAQRPPNQAESA